MARFVTVLRHSSYLFGSKLLTRLLFTVFFLLAASKLGPEHFGALAFALAFAELLSWIGDLGITVYGARELVGVEEERRPTLNGQILVIQLISSIILSLAGLLFVVAWGPDYPNLELMLLALVAVLLSGFVNASESALISSQKFHLSAMMSLAGRIVFIVAGLAALGTDASVVVVMGCFVAGVAVESVLRIFLVAGRVVRYAFDFRVRELGRLIRSSLPFAAAAIASVIYAQSGILVLGLTRGDADVGVYSLANSIFIPFIWATTILARVTLPGITSLYQKDQEAARSNIRQWYRLAAMLGMPLAIIIGLLAETVFSGYSADYADSAAVLAILAAVIPFAMLAAIELNVMQIIGRERGAAVSLVVGAAVTVALNLSLTPFWGVFGASAALLGGAVVREAVIFSMTSTSFISTPYLIIFSRPILGSLAMGTVAFLAWPLGAVPASIFAAMAYLFTIVATRALKLSEIRELFRD